mmetsp:Transcript_96621/g.191531  ORF Transcript_96621/g.191531 Transcript_96621/m.191531 type:complete len:177 (-) Transcript_96621:1165-1695(-)
MAWLYASRPVSVRMPNTAAGVAAVVAAAAAAAAVAPRQPLQAKAADLPQSCVMALEWPACNAAARVHPASQMEATSFGRGALGEMPAEKATSTTAVGSPHAASVLGILLGGFLSMAKLVTISSLGEVLRLVPVLTRKRWRKMVGDRRWQAGGTEAQLAGVVEAKRACLKCQGLAKI